jgi:hypothetical protein
VKSGCLLVDKRAKLKWSGVFRDDCWVIDSNVKYGLDRGSTSTHGVILPTHRQLNLHVHRFRNEPEAADCLRRVNVI